MDQASTTHTKTKICKSCSESGSGCSPASYNYPNAKPEYCNLHRSVNMVLIRNQIPQQPSSEEQ